MFEAQLALQGPLELSLEAGKMSGPKERRGDVSPCLGEGWEETDMALCIRKLI